MVASVQGLLQSFGNALGVNTSVLGTDLENLLQLLFSTQSLTAYTTGGQANATPITAAIATVTTVFTTAASVLLPPAIPGRAVTLMNHGAQSMQVYGYAANPNNSNTSDVIVSHNSVSPTNATGGVSQTSGSVGEYYCYTAGTWKQLLTS